LILLSVSYSTRRLVGYRDTPAASDSTTSRHDADIRPNSFRAPHIDPVLRYKYLLVALLLVHYRPTNDHLSGKIDDELSNTIVPLPTLIQTVFLHSEISVRCSRLCTFTQQHGRNIGTNRQSTPAQHAQYFPMADIDLLLSLVFDLHTLRTRLWFN
jgi:hypothetical protein